MSFFLEEMMNLVDVTISDSELQASISIGEEMKETPLQVNQLKEILTKKNVVFGIDEELLTKICISLEEYVDKSIEIAAGILPKDGIDGYIEWTVAPKTENKIQELEDGSVDYYSVNKISNITKGQLIATKIPSTQGENGITVTGKEIIAKKGKEAHLKQGKNVVLNENKDKIYAAIDGQVVITDQNKINVFPIYEVSGDVDMSIGNIDFVGTVVIRGNVPDGFKIKAAGEIKVYGNVEGVELIADGDIFIQQGVIGHNKSQIRTNGSFKAGYILDGNVYAKDNVLVNQSIMHSIVTAGRQIICKGHKGIIVGGKLQAGEAVIASVIGNYMATATSIEVGINPDIRKELTEIQNKKLGLEDSFDKVLKGIALLDRVQKEEGNLSPDKKKLQIHLMNQRLVIEKELKQMKGREQELEEQLNDFDNTNIQVHKVVYPGVKLVIGRVVKNIKTEIKYMKFVLEDREMVAKPM